MTGPRSSSLAVLAWGIVAAVVAALAIAPFVAAEMGHARRHAASPQAKIGVCAGIPPLAYLAQRIGGPHVDAFVLVQPGQDPHVFEPSPRQVIALERADLLLRIGMPFETQLAEKAAADNPRLQVVDVSEGLATLPAEDEPEHHDAYGADSCDPHIWLSPRLLKVQAARIASALERIDSPHAETYRENLAALQSDLDALDARLRRAFRRYRGQTFFVFHPAFGYFAHDYGLHQKSVEIEGKSPTPRQLLELVKQARAENVQVVFLQPRFDPRTADTIAAALGGVVARMDPLAPNVVANLNAVAENIAGALEASHGH